MVFDVLLLVFDRGDGCIHLILKKRFQEESRSRDKSLLNSKRFLSERKDTFISAETFIMKKGNDFQSSMSGKYLMFV